MNHERSVDCGKVDLRDVQAEVKDRLPFVAPVEHSLQLDMVKDDISCLGTFHLIYSIGNVMSHLKKDGMNDALRKIRGCLVESGIFLFDVLISGQPFREEIHEDDLRIVWKRKLNEQTGCINMVGTFLEFGVTQHFEVWAYTVQEMTELLKHAGFSHIGLRST